MTGLGKITQVPFGRPIHLVGFGSLYKVMQFLR